MTTFTASAAYAGVQPRVNKNGAIFPIVSLWTAGTSIANSDVIFLAKLANQVWIHGWEAAYLGGADTQTLVTLRVGTVAISGTLTGSSTATFLHNSQNKGNGLPFKLSLTDNADPQFSYINILPSGSTTTTTAVFNITLYCSFNPEPP